MYILTLDCISVLDCMTIISFFLKETSIGPLVVLGGLIEMSHKTT